MNKAPTDPERDSVMLLELAPVTPPRKFSVLGARARRAFTSGYPAMTHPVLKDRAKPVLYSQRVELEPEAYSSLTTLSLKRKAACSRL
ncbi:hypothetical protein TgHK011_009343 [Trichoderma gracile]|nr:hypothetical protein TgHK011_009343 [Trichoderma gracile]